MVTNIYIHWFFQTLYDLQWFGRKSYLLTGRRSLFGSCNYEKCLRLARKCYFRNGENVGKCRTNAAGFHMDRDNSPISCFFSGLSRMRTVDLYFLNCKDYTHVRALIYNTPRQSIRGETHSLLKSLDFALYTCEL